MEDTSDMYKVIEGLRLIHQNGGETVTAEHDQLFAGHEVKAMTRGDRERLEELGWERDDDLGCWTKGVG